MAKRVAWTQQAKADIRAIEQPKALQILRTLARYAQTGRETLVSYRVSSHPYFVSAHRITAYYPEIRGNIWKSPACWTARTLIAKISRRSLGVVPRFGCC